MQQVYIDQHGGPEVLKVRDVAVPTPKADEILIELRACGLNFIDVYHRSGLYPVSLPSGLGLEGAGVVTAIGEGVTRFKVGDHAAFCTGPMGAYAQFACVSEKRAVLVPNCIGLDVAAAILLKGLTAEFLVRRLVTLSPKDFVLFHAAAGGVGLIACDWLAHLGVEVIGTVGSPGKAELAVQHGCAHTIQYRHEDVAARIGQITQGQKCRVVYDSVGADTIMASLDSAARRGLVVSFGNASGPPPAIAPLDLAKRGSLMFTRPTLFDFIATTKELDDAAAALFSLVLKGIIKPVIGARYGLSEVAQAHKDLEARSTIGASLILPTQ